MGVPNPEYILKAEPTEFPGREVRETDWHQVHVQWENNKDGKDWGEQ